MNATHGDISSACASVACSLCPFEDLVHETGSDILSTTEYDELFARIIPLAYTGKQFQDMPQRAVAALSCRLFAIAAVEMSRQRRYPDYHVQIENMGVYISLLATIEWEKFASVYLLELSGVAHLADWSQYGFTGSGDPE